MKAKASEKFDPADLPSRRTAKSILRSTFSRFFWAACNECHSTKKIKGKLRLDAKSWR